MLRPGQYHRRTYVGRVQLPVGRIQYALGVSWLGQDWASFAHPLFVPFTTVRAPLLLKVVKLALSGTAMKGGIVLSTVARPVPEVAVLMQ